MIDKIYRSIVEDYDAARKRELSRFVTYPSFSQLVGNASGLDVLDAGCGGGFSTRILKHLGARKVVGIDITPEQIRLANQYEQKYPLGIEYLVGDISKNDLQQVGMFDLVTSVHCINHSRDKKELQSTVYNLSDILKKNGKFVGIVSSPGIGEKGYDKYGINYQFLNGFGDGNPLHAVISSFEGHVFCELDEYYYSFKTFKEVFENAGLTLNWHKPLITNEGIQSRGKEFWNEFLRSPPILLFEALKKD